MNSGYNSNALGYLRPQITYSCGKFQHNGSTVRVVLRRELISVGCTDVTPDALRKMLAEYDARFAKCEEVVLQP